MIIATLPYRLKGITEERLIVVKIGGVMRKYWRYVTTLEKFQEALKIS